MTKIIIIIAILMSSAICSDDYIKVKIVEVYDRKNIGNGMIENKISLGVVLEVMPINIVFKDLENLKDHLEARKQYGYIGFDGLKMTRIITSDEKYNALQDNLIKYLKEQKKFPVMINNSAQQGVAPEPVMRQ